MNFRQVTLEHGNNLRVRALRKQIHVTVKFMGSREQSQKHARSCHKQQLYQRFVPYKDPEENSSMSPLQTGLAGGLEDIYIMLGNKVKQNKKVSIPKATGQYRYYSYEVFLSKYNT